MIIERPDLVDRIQRPNGWTLVHGRRKTGKTFLLRRFVPHETYYFVKGDRTVLAQRSDAAPRPVGQEAFMEILVRDLADGRTIVVDEFHRLGDDFLDTLHAIDKHGKLILVSSTLFLAKRLLGRRSPLLGLVQEVPVPLVTMADALRALDPKRVRPKDRVELAVLLREPITADIARTDRRARTSWRHALRATTNTVPSLVGEVFSEERRRVTGIYEGILRAVATGKTGSGEITGHLFGRRLIDKQDPSMIQSHLTNLVKVGMLDKLPVYGSNRRVYRHTSPLASLYYHADERYNLSERTPSDAELDRIVAEALPRLVENAVRTALAEALGLTEAVAEASDHDVDACLLRFNKPAVVAEIKWTDRIDRADIRKAEDALAHYDAPRRVLFVPDRSTAPQTSLEVLDADDLIAPA